MPKPVTRVLVVEDNPDFSDLMRVLLTRYEIEAVIMNSGEKALACLSKDTFDLILLDIALPGMNGLEVCHQIKESPRLKHIPIIFVTGQTSAAYKREAKRLGAVDYIEKPFDLLPFLKCIMGHLKLPTLPERDIRALKRSAVEQAQPEGS
jgi:CheY-like chemotaxis protein